MGGGGRARWKLARPCHYCHLPYPRRRAPFAHMRIVPCQVGREGGREGKGGKGRGSRKRKREGGREGRRKKEGGREGRREGGDGYSYAHLLHDF